MVSAVAVAKNVFAAHKIGAEQLPDTSVTPLPINEAAEAQRASRFRISSARPFRASSITQLWLRPDLAPRDRSLVTVRALIANRHTAQLTPHLNRAMDNGLTRTEASEAITQLAFYVGWPNVLWPCWSQKMSSEKRPH